MKQELCEYNVFLFLSTSLTFQWVVLWQTSLLTMCCFNHSVLLQWFYEFCWSVLSFMFWLFPNHRKSQIVSSSGLPSKCQSDFFNWYICMNNSYAWKTLINFYFFLYNLTCILGFNRRQKSLLEWNFGQWWNFSVPHCALWYSRTHDSWVCEKLNKKKPGTFDLDLLNLFTQKNNTLSFNLLPILLTKRMREKQTINTGYAIAEKDNSIP